MEGSWPELLQMLIDGEIDLMSDVSYTEDRAGQMLFSSLPMGLEGYYVFVSADNAELQSGSVADLQWKKVGFSKNSIRKLLFLELLDKYGVKAEIVELGCLTHHAHIKLHNIEGQHVERHERRIPGAEIIELDLEP